MAKWLYLITGGVLGTLARHIVSTLVYQRAAHDFPYGTLAVNMAGCFLVGFFDVIIEKKFSMGPQMRILLMAGFCGAFTTFSTFMLETGNLLKEGEMFRALANVLVSVLLGFIVFRFGIWLAKFI